MGEGHKYRRGTEGMTHNMEEIGVAGKAQTHHKFKEIYRWTLLFSDKNF